MPTVSPAMIARSHTVGEPRWSPSGNWLGWLDSWDSRTDLVVAPSDGTLPPSVISADHPVTSAGAYGGGGWAWISDDVVAVAGADGRLAVLRRDGGGVVRQLTERSAGRSSAPAASPSGTHVAVSLETDTACAVHVVAVADGSSRVLSAADYAWDPAWSPDGRLVAWHEWDIARMSWQASRIMVGAADGSTPPVVVDGAEGGIAVGQPRFSPDGTKLAWVSDRSGWWNVWWAEIDGDGAVGQAWPLRSEANDHAGPAWGPGQRTFGWAPDSSAIAFERNESGFGRLVVASLDGAVTDDLAKAHHRGIHWSTAGIVASRSGAKTPQQIVRYDPSTRERAVVARGPVAGFEACSLVEPTMVTWASGGTTVHGCFRTPVDVDHPPLLVMVHGGPTDQATAEWNPRAAFWVSRGWAVLQVNYRGSTGYGRTYRDALDGGWGVADVDDVASGIRHAVASGWCDQNRVVVTGGSAGGFTALLVCALHGDLVHAGVSLFGVADLAALAATTHRFESTYLDGLVGALPEHADLYRDRSPITHAHRITVPMLVLQGRDDIVVPIEQSDAMVAAMRAAGADVEYQVYDGEGHGFRKLVNVVDEYERTEAFLRRTVLEAPR